MPKIEPKDLAYLVCSAFIEGLEKGGGKQFTDFCQTAWNDSRAREQVELLTRDEEETPDE